jgi:hypothetical protein
MGATGARKKEGMADPAALPAPESGARYCDSRRQQRGFPRRKHGVRESFAVEGAGYDGLKRAA